MSSLTGPLKSVMPVALGVFSPYFHYAFCTHWLLTRCEAMGYKSAYVSYVQYVKGLSVGGLNKSAKRLWRGYSVSTQGT